MTRLSEGQLLRRIGRSGEIGHRTGGVLAEIRILEHAMLRERCGPDTDDQLDLAVASMLSLDSRFDEQLCRTDGGRYLVLLPRAAAANAESRMQRFLDRTAEQTIDIRGNEVSIAATLGWITYTPEESPIEIARRVRDVVESEQTATETKPASGRVELLFQLLWSLTVAVTVPYIVYVLVDRADVDLRVVSLPAMVLAAMWSFLSALRISSRSAAEPADPITVRNSASSWTTKLMSIEVRSQRSSMRDGPWAAGHRTDDDVLVTSHYAPTTVAGLWREYVRQRRYESVRAGSADDHARGLGHRFAAVGAAISPWVSIHLIPVLLFTVWRREPLTDLSWVTWFAIAFVALRLGARAIETVLALRRVDPALETPTGWKVSYAMSAMTWFGEFRNAAYRIGQMHFAAAPDAD